MTTKLIGTLITRDRDESVHRPRYTYDVTHMINIKAPTSDCAHNPKDFGDCLADIDYYFDWYKHV